MQHQTYLQVQAVEPNLEDLPEKDDEKPVVVVLKQGDLTAEEAEKGISIYLTLYTSGSQTFCDNGTF